MNHFMNHYNEIMIFEVAFIFSSLYFTLVFFFVFELQQAQAYGQFLENDYLKRVQIHIINILRLRWP